MLESLLADVLTRVLGQYICGIDRDSINFGIWGGCLELRSLVLRPEALAVLFETLGMELPVTVCAGFIGLLRIVVPWKTLGSTPVQVYVQRVTIVARPVRGDASNTSELQVRERRLTRAKLATDDAVREASWAVESGSDSSDKSSESGGWASRLASKVVENMQIEIADIIVRFEDAISDKRRPYVVAVLCDSIKAVSANAKWQQAFVDSSTEHSAFTRKIVQLVAFRVTWTPLNESQVIVSRDSASLNDPALLNTHSSLRQFIENEHESLHTSSEEEAGLARTLDKNPNRADNVPASSVPEKRTKCIMRPFDGVMRVCIAKRQVSTGSSERKDAAAVELDVRFREIALELDDVQYACILQTSVYFARLASRGIRPTTPRDWWMWAVEQIFPGFRSRRKAEACLSEDGLQLRNKKRQSYVTARVAVLKARRTGLPEPEEIVAELEAAERNLSLQDIFLYRDIADDEYARTWKTWEQQTDTCAAEKSSGTTTSTLWTLLGYSSTSEGVKVGKQDDLTCCASESDMRPDGTGLHHGALAEGNAGIEEGENENEISGLDSSKLTSGGDKFVTPTLCAGVSFDKLSLRMKKGGFPSSSIPKVELILRDFSLGVTTTSGHGLLLEAILGTCEAWDLSSGSPFVYPRVPWNVRKTSVAAHDLEVDQTVEENVELDESMRKFDVDRFYIHENAGQQSSAMSEADMLFSSRSRVLQIPNSSYPLSVCSALLAIRESFSSFSYGPDGSDPQNFEVEEEPLHSENTGEQSCGGDECAATEVGHLPNISFVDDSATDCSRASRSGDSMTGSSSIREHEFLGLGGVDGDVESLDYLAAIRLHQQPISDEALWNAGASRLSLDVAVGRLEAVVDGPDGALLWGLRFWQPKGIKNDPIMAFLGAAAGARVAELRMELESALLSRQEPMCIDAVICAPRFVLPGKSRDSPTIVVNTGTLKFGSPSRGTRASSKWNKSERHQSSGERYTHYAFALRDLGVYLAPNFGTAVSANLGSLSAFVDSGKLGLDTLRCSDPALLASQRAAQVESNDNSSRNSDWRNLKGKGIERIVRPCFLQLSLQLLQDAQIVQVARLGLQRTQSSRLAKVRIRTRISSIFLILSQRACQQIIMMVKNWAAGLRHLGQDTGAAIPYSSDASSPSKLVMQKAQSSPHTCTLRALDVNHSSETALYSNVAGLDIKLDINTIGVELRDRKGLRIVTCAASGMHGNLLKTGCQDLSAHFRLHSWTVTDGSRGVTAAFRRLAHAGESLNERGVSPPHTLSSSSLSERSNSSSDSRNAFVQVSMKHEFATGDRYIKFRFLSLRMMCVRETYSRIAAFAHGLLKDVKRARPVERTSFQGSNTSGTTKVFLERLPDSRNYSDLSQCEVARLLPDSETETQDRAIAGRGRLNIHATFDGFVLQLVAAEGALASIEMNACHINAEMAKDGSMSASGDIECFFIRDLTSPVEEHSDVLSYRRQSEILERGLDENGRRHQDSDKWEILIPSEGNGRRWFRGSFRGLRIIFLTRFATIIGRYVSSLCEVFRPALNEAKLTIETSDQSFENRSNLEASKGMESGIRSTGLEAELCRTQSDFVVRPTMFFEISAENVIVILPRHSSCPSETVTLAFGDIHVDNENLALQEYQFSWRLVLSNVGGAVTYQTPGSLHSSEWAKDVCLQSTHAEYRVDLVRKDCAREENSSRPSSLAGEMSQAELPAIRVRFIAGERLDIQLCEAQYTVMYFVLTENFSEIADANFIDFGLPSSFKDDCGGDNCLSRVPGKDRELGRESSSLNEDSLAHVGTFLHLTFQIPELSVIIARGWNVSDVSTYIFSCHFSNLTGTLDITDVWRIVVQLTSDVTGMCDLRQEVESTPVYFVSPLVDGVMTETRHDVSLDGPAGMENISLSYDKAYGQRASIALVLSSIQLSIIPELFRDLSAMAVPGWPFLESSAFAPDAEYLGRVLVVTLTKSEVLLGCSQFVGDTRAVILRGDIIARVTWMHSTGARQVSLQTKGLSLSVTYESKQQGILPEKGKFSRPVGIRASENDALLIYPGDGSLEYVGPNVDNAGRRLEITGEYVLCRVNVKEVSILLAIYNRFGRLKESYLSSRKWTQSNPLAAAARIAVGGNKDTLASNQALATRKTLTLLMSTPAARFLFTDESKGKFVPIMECNLRDVMLQANMPRVIQLSGEVSVNLFNDAKGWWEPGIESWPVESSISIGESGSVAVVVISDSKLDLNLKPSTITAACRVSQSVRTASISTEINSDTRDFWASNPASDRPSVAAFHVRNDLGKAVTLWLPEDVRRRTIHVGEETEIDLPRESLVPNASSRSVGDDNAARAKQLRCNVSLSGYSPLELSASEVGAHVVTFSQDLTDVAMDSRHHVRSSECQDLLVVWDVSMKSGVPICTLRSFLRLKNETETPLEIGVGTGLRDANIFTEEKDVLTQLLQPGNWFSIPVEHVRSEIRIRPLIIDPPDPDEIEDANSFSSDSQTSSHIDGTSGTDIPETLQDTDCTGSRDKSRKINFSSELAAPELCSGTEFSGCAGFDSQYAFDWSSPLPDSSWLWAKGLEMSQTSQSRKKDTPGSMFMRQFASTSSDESSSVCVLSDETVCCASRRHGGPEFFVDLCPRVELMKPTSRNSAGTASPRLDLIIQAPLVFENILPRAISYQVLRDVDDKDISREADVRRNVRVLASGVVHPFKNVYIHAAGAMRDCYVALAYNNSIHTSNEVSQTSEECTARNESLLPPTLFGIPVAVADVRSGNARVLVEPPASASSLGFRKKREFKELSIRTSPHGLGSSAIELWCPFWIRNRSDVSLEFCGRSSFYGSTSAVKPLPALPPGTLAHDYICFEGPFISLRRNGGQDAADISSLASASQKPAIHDWWTHGSDLRDTVKPITVEVPGVSLMMEVRPAMPPVQRSMIVTIRNSAWIVNRTPHALQWCQASALDAHGNARLRFVSTLSPGDSQSIHWDSKSDSRAVSLRLADEGDDGFSGWFWSPPVPMAIGNRGEFPAKMYRPKSQEQYIARVLSVKLHGGSTALFVHHEDRNNPPYRVSNLCQRRSIAFHQVASEDRPWLLRPGKSTRYSWDDPLAPARNRQLQIEVIEDLKNDKQGVDLEFGAALDRSNESGRWARETSAQVLPEGCIRPEYHHPKFSLSIDVVSTAPVVKKGTFDPNLLVLVSVDGATKTVTFYDADTFPSASDPRPGQSDATYMPKSLYPEGNPSSLAGSERKSRADVPTIRWDDIAHPSIASSDISESLQRSVASVERKFELTSDYPRGSVVDLEAMDEIRAPDSTPRRDIDMKLFLSSIGVSLIDSSPLELAYGYASGVSARYERYSEGEEFAFDITDLQIDNQLLSAAFPVLLTASPLERRLSNRGEMSDVRAGENLASIKTLAVEGKRILASHDISMWKCVRGAIRPLEIGLDEEIVVRFVGFLSDIARGADDSCEIIAAADGEHHPLSLFGIPRVDEQEKAPNGNDSLHASNDLFQANMAVDNPFLTRMYMEELKFYPVKVFLSSSASRGSVTLKSAGYKSASVRLLVAILLNVENCELDFAALELQHVFDTTEHFALLLREYYLTQFNNQRMKLLTSNSLIGNPAALFDSVSIGARDLFVEPGKAKDSVEFLTSVGKGSRSLFTHTVGGIVGSFGGFSRALTSGLETAVGDRRYIAERERIHGQQFSGSLRQLSATPAQGVVTGAMSFAHGISSGVTGLLKEPVLGARQGGATGFFKGVGRGLVGGVVKPVAGAIDLIAEPAVGISKHVSDVRRQSCYGMLPVRPPRTFWGTGMRLIPFDMRSATGRVLLAATQQNSSDFLGDELLDWIELSDRQGRNERDAVDILWLVIRKYSRGARGSRRRRSRSRASSSEATLTLGGAPFSEEYFGSLEKTRVALITESRLVVATLDCALVSVIKLDFNENVQVCDEGKAIVLQTTSQNCETYSPQPVQIAGRYRDHMAQSRSQRPVGSRVLERVQCGSTAARDDLHRALERTLLTMREKSRLAATPSRSNGSNGLEMQKVTAAGSSSALETPLMPTNRTTAADGRPNVFEISALPGRDGAGIPLATLDFSPASNFSGVQQMVKTGSLDTKDKRTNTSVSDLEPSVRRLAMGGTKRAVDAKRSVRMIVAFSAREGRNLRLIRSSLNSGTWRVQPPTSITSGEASLFEADSGSSEDKSDQWHLNRDVRGSVLYGMTSEEGFSRFALPTGDSATALRASQVILEFENSALSVPRFTVQCSSDIVARYEGGKGTHATAVFYVASKSAQTDFGGFSPQPPVSSRTQRTSAFTRSMSSLSNANAASSGSQSPFGAMSAAGGRLLKAGGRLFDVATSATSSSSSAQAHDTAESRRRMNSDRQSPVVDQNSVEQLIQLGFERDLVVIALQESGGDLVRAVDLLTR